MENAGLISRSDAIATCTERRKGERGGRRVHVALRTARDIATRLRQVPEVSRPLGQRVYELTASLEQEVGENARLERKLAEVLHELELLKAEAAA